MRDRWLAVVRVPSVLLLALSLQMSAQTSGVKADNDPTDVETVKRLERKLCDLLVTGDWDSYARQLTDDYVRILPGKVQTKQEVLEEFRTSRTKTVAMVPEKIDVRVYGDTAIVIIDLRTRNQAPDGSVTESRGRPTKVFLRRNGVWYLAQLSGMPLK